MHGIFSRHSHLPGEKNSEQSIRSTPISPISNVSEFKAPPTPSPEVIPPAERIKIQAAWISLWASGLVLGIKLYAYFQTQSAAILSDALESIVNVLSASIALVVVRLAARPADERHPYGRGKLEYFSSSSEGALITFAACAIGVEATSSLFSGQAIEKIQTGVHYSLIATAINLILGLGLLWVSKKYGSEALKASGHHVLSDVYTTIGVLAGLFLVQTTGLKWLDGVTALIIALQLGWIGVRIIRSSMGALTDEVDQTSLEHLSRAFTTHRRSGFIDIHKMRLIRSGNFHHIDAHLVVPCYWDVTKAHDLAEELEGLIVASYPYDGEVAFHLDPCKKSYCTICDIPDCSIRARPFLKLRQFCPENMVKSPMKDPEIPPQSPPPESP